MLLSDYRHGFRALARRPGFALLAIVTLGIGVGATTTIFSALYRLNYAQLPYETADRLVTLGRTQEGQGFFVSPTPQLVDEWRQHSQLLEQVVMAIPLDLTLLGEGEPTSLQGARVTTGLPEMLGESPLLGRTFTEDEAADDAPVVVLSEGVWRTHFGAARAVIGRSIRLGDMTRTVIGVMSSDFGRYSDPFPRQEFWLPLRHTPEDSWGNAIGLLRAGVTPEAASAELGRIAAASDLPTPSGTWVYRAMPISEMLSEGTRRTFPILLGAVALVLLIACANVAGLMIVRLNARRREIAIRAALGARHRRILGGLLAEQVLLTLGAGVVGLLLAAWSMSFIAQVAPQGLPLLDTLRLEPAVLAFAGGLLLTTTLLAGVLPAQGFLRADPADALRAGGDRVTSGSRARSLLVTGQIALSVVLLVGAVLLIRSFAALQSRDHGFEPDGVLAVEIALPPERYSPEQKTAFLADLVEGMGTIAGVESAAVGGAAPPDFGLIFGTLTVAESNVGTEDIGFLAGTSAPQGYLPTLGARFVSGRDFNATDGDAAIVNRSFVERFWPGEDGVGKRIRLTTSPEEPWTTIVGVVEDLIGRTHTPGGEAELQVFQNAEWFSPTHWLLVRVNGGDALSVLPAVKQVVSRIDRQLPLRDVATLEDRMAVTVARERFNMVLLSLFAGVALLLSVVGLYGLVAYTVQQRQREIAIRVALGASAGAVRGLFVGHGMKLVAAGVTVGVAGALLTVRVLQSMIYDLPVYDVLSFASAVTLIAGAALLASWLPARSAARVDPLVPLREQ